MSNTPESGMTDVGADALGVETKRYQLIPFEKRDINDENRLRDSYATGEGFSIQYAMLQDQQADLFEELDNQGVTKSVVDDVDYVQTKHIDAQTEYANKVASSFAETVVVDTRGGRINLEHRGEAEDELIDAFIEKEELILSDMVLISETTAASILKQVENAIDMNLTVQELKRNIMDTGTFSDARALRISRTLTGTASSIGQLSGGIAAGATKKIWKTSRDGTVRSIHADRQNEEVDIDDRFSIRAGRIGPRFPLDNETDVSDRVNCRCSMTFN